MTTPTRLRYVTLDVFTKTRYAGNPLGVVYLPTTHALNQEQKQKIAREFNYSETIFIHENEDPTAVEHKIDIFMTNTELPFAGHPTIGAAWLLARASKGEEERRSILTKAGPIAYRFDAEGEVASIEVPHDVHLHGYRLSNDEVAAAGVPASVAHQILGLSTVISIVKGMTFAMIELPSKEVLSAVSGSVNASKVGSKLDESHFSGFLGTWYFVNNGRKEDGTVKISSRMIMNGGVLEDPATGSAASAFSVYWAKRALAERKEGGNDEFVTEFDIEQGVDMGRPSSIQTKVVLDAKSSDVRRVVLGGSAVQVMEGFLVI